MANLVYTNENCIGCNKCIGACSCEGANVAKNINGQTFFRGNQHTKGCHMKV